MENRFIVPQFIDSEDKIWGPITVRQFLIVLVGGLFEFISYKLADFGLFIFETLIIVILVVLFAFYKVNGAPFHVFALNFVQTMKRPRIRIWKKEYIKVEEFKTKKDKKEDIAKQQEAFEKKSLAPSKKLSELSLVIDTGGVYKGEQDANKINNLNYE